MCFLRHRVQFPVFTFSLLPWCFSASSFPFFLPSFLPVFLPPLLPPFSPSSLYYFHPSSFLVIVCSTFIQCGIMSAPGVIQISNTSPLKLKNSYPVFPASTDLLGLGILITGSSQRDPSSNKHEFCARIHPDLFSSYSPFHSA